MFFRTKHFFLVVLASIGLLLIAIFCFTSRFPAVNQEAGAFLVLENNDQEKDYFVETDSEISVSEKKERRLKEMTIKIAEMIVPEMLKPEPEPEPEPEILEVDDDITESEVNLCTNFKVYTGSWSASNLSFEVVEGARLLLRETDLGPEVAVQLPILSTPFGSATCLGSDVVGVALDGSLIRNGDYRIYNIFGFETLIGYALDGFPIYGLNSDVSPDSCGGAVVSGQYRYYLNSEREGVIGCFAGSPVSL